MEAQESASDGVGLLVLEAKSLRPFKTKDEYLYAMKEDLAEWFKCLYTEILIDADNFLDVLETGVVLCQHANEVRKFTVEQKAKGVFEMKSNFVRDIQIPQYDVQFRVDVKPGTFLSRDNISNFITWTAKMGIPEVLRFETDDLVMRKNERSVVLCLLEVARVGAKFGMLAPTIVQMEEEIDAEIETGEPPPQIKTCDIKSLDEMVRELVGRCTCPVQFPIIKVGEGKYKIGDNQTLVFVRILRKHVMIRVGGGWDTLEHYLDRHDPCRCRFEGHQRGPGRGPTTPRRSSSSNVSNSVPNTPKSPRKLSMTTPVHSSHSGSARPASPGISSQSPGPNSKRKLSLVVKGESNSQPASCVTSPNIIGKAPNFSNTCSSRDKVIQEDVNSSGNISFGNFVKQSQNSISRQISSGYGGGTLPRQVTPRRSASPAFRAQSPGPRRSESPAPVPTHRLRSPSPVHSKKKGASTNSESRKGQCESPIKQITLTEVRSSREGKPTPSHTADTPRSVRRQTSTTSSNGDSSEMASDGTKPNLTIDKISTMSLGEFKSLLNSALSVPNGAGGSDSPRSQTSVDSNNRKASLTSNAGHNPSPYKSAPGSRSTSANRAGTAGSSYYPSKLGSVKPKEKSCLDSSSSGYSTASSSVDKPVRSSPSVTNTRSGTPSGRVSSSVGKSVSNTSIRSETSGGGHDKKRPRTPKSIFKSNSNSSNVSEISNTLQPAFNNASRSSSHSSLKSYESTDSHSFDERASQQSEPAERGDRIPLTPGSATSDYSYRNSYTSNPESPGQKRSYRISYTSNPESPGQIRSDTDCGHSLASKCVCREQNGIVPTAKEQPVVEENPRNVGYSYMFSYSDNQVKEPENSANNKHELNNLEQELADLTAKADDEMDLIHGASSDDQQITKPVRSHTPNGRSHTPSFLPVPITPKSSRKPLSTHVTDSDKSSGRPPTPRKSNIIARAPASTVRSADRSREQTYRDIFHKRSMTPGPEGRSSTTSQVNARRSSTPGPYLHKSNLSSTSATTTRALLNESLTQKGKSGQLSVFNGDTPTTTGRSRRELVGSAHQRTQSMDRKALIKQYSNENQEAETVIIVNRSNGQHSLNVQGEEVASTRQTPNKSKVLARARVDDTRSRNEARKPISRQRPQSVEPRQLVPRKQLTVHNGTTDNAAGEDDHLAYNRTQEWVQTAVANTKVKKSKTTKVLPRSRRAMTPNSFDMHRDMDDNEEPRTLDEIKAALSLPINGITSIDPDTIEAPPENPDMYNQMEKLFNELRQQELKSSVNETPGVASNDIKPNSKSKSNSSANDEDSSLDSNRNIRKKTLSVSTKTSSNATSPPVSRSDKSPATSLRSHGSHGVPKRPSSPSPKIPGSSASVSNKDGDMSSGLSGQKTLSGRTQTVPVSSRATSHRPSSPAFKAQPHSQRLSTSSMSSNTGRPISPALKVQTQRSTPSSASTNRPASPAFKGRPQSPSPSTHSQRPASPSFKSHSSRSSVSSSSSQPPRPSSPSAKVKPTHSTPRPQPARPASTPPQPSTPVSRQSSKASDDSVFETSDKKVDSIVGAGLLSKLKEIIKVKPRKDKQDKVKTRIPAPKSLASHRKSQSFSNLSTLSDTMSLAHTCPDLGKYVSDSQHIDSHGKENGWCGDETLNGVSSKADPPQPRLMTPLNTGRSTLIRKESMDKNKEFRKLARAVSVERNMNTMNVYPYLDEGEYV